MSLSDLVGLNLPSGQFFTSDPFNSEEFGVNAPSNMTEVLSRYHFMGVTQTRSFYSEYSLSPSNILRLEKVVQIIIPSNPEVSSFLRQLKLYFYMTDGRGKIVPLKGVIQMDRRGENNWIPVSVSNVEWSFVENEDQNERYNRLLFSPLKIEPSQSENGVNTYEIRIQFEPEIPMGRAIKLYTKGSDKQQIGNVEVYHPAMSVYFTTCPQDSDYCHNLLLEVISSLIGIADKSGIYNNTEYNGAASKVLAAIPHLRVTSDVRKQLVDNQSNWQSTMDKLNDMIDRQPQVLNFSNWAGQINMNEISRLRNENTHLRQQLSQMELNR